MLAVVCSLFDALCLCFQLFSAHYQPYAHKSSVNKYGIVFERVKFISAAFLRNSLRMLGGEVCVHVGLLFNINWSNSNRLLVFSVHNSEKNVSCWAVIASTFVAFSSFQIENWVRVRLTQYWICSAMAFLKFPYFSLLIVVLFAFDMFAWLAFVCKLCSYWIGLCMFSILWTQLNAQLTRITGSHFDARTHKSAKRVPAMGVQWVHFSIISWQCIRTKLRVACRKNILNEINCKMEFAMHHKRSAIQNSIKW